MIGDVHINGSEAAMGDGAADGAGEGEARVEGDAAELLGGVGVHFRRQFVQLRAGFLRGRAHRVGVVCVGVDGWIGEVWRRWMN